MIKKKKQLLIENFIIAKGLFKEVPLKIDESTDVGGEAKRILRRISGPMGVVDVKTGNGRRYPYGEVMKAVTALKPRMESRTVFGQLDHPATTPSYKDVSHFVNKLWVENYDGVKYMFGEWDIIDTPNGQILNSIYEAGGGIGASYRGFGNVDEATGDVSDYDLVSVDAVVDPSASTFISEKNFKKGAQKNESQEDRDDIKKMVTELYQMVESLKANANGKVPIVEAQIAPKVVIVESNTEENPVKIKMKVDGKIGETDVKAGQTVSVEDETALAGLGENDYEVVIERSDVPADKKLAEIEKASELKDSKITTQNKKLAEEKAKVEKLVKICEDLKKYTLNVEKVGETIAEELRNQAKRGAEHAEIIENLRAYALVLEGKVDGEVRDFIVKTVEALEDMSNYAKILETTVDTDLAPYARKLEEVIDKEFTPYVKKLESVVEDMKAQIADGTIYENSDPEKVEMVEKIIATYPQLENMQTELLQSRNDTELEERLHKYISLFSHKKVSEHMGMSKAHKYIATKKLDEKSASDQKDKNSFKNRFQNMFETQMD